MRSISFFVFLTLFIHSLQAQIIIGSEYICLNGVTELSVADDYALSYDWSTGENTQSISATVPGWYYLDMVDMDGNLLMDSIFLILSAAPDDDISLNGPQNICLGSFTNLEVSSGYEYQWSNGLNDASITVSTSGNYFCIITDSITGCQSITDTISIGIYDFLNIEVSSEGLLCIGDEVTLTAPLASTYDWNTGENTQSITVAGSGSYTVSVFNGICTSELSQNVIFNASPALDLGPDVSLCPDDILNLCGPPGMNSYTWCTGETTECISISAADGIYCLEIESQNGCISSDSLEITLIESAAAEIEILNGSANGCEGDTLVLEAGGSVQSWSTGAFTQSIEVSTSGIYWVLSTDDSGCSTDTAFLEIILNALPEAIITSDEDLVQCPADDYSITLSTGEYETFLWSAFTIGSELEVDEPGEYYVIVTDINGCIDTSDVVTVGLFTVPNIGAISGSNTATIHTEETYILTNFSNVSYHWNVTGGEFIGDSTGNEISVLWSELDTAQVCGWIETSDGCTSDTSCLSINLMTSLNETLNTSELRLWPNPVKDELHWHSDAEMESISILDSMGRNYNIEELEHLADGLYFLLAQDYSGRKYMQSFIKL